LADGSFTCLSYSDYSETKVKNQSTKHRKTRRGMVFLQGIPGQPIMVYSRQESKSMTQTVWQN
jgi:hypothetical protein